MDVVVLLYTTLFLSVHIGSYKCLEVHKIYVPGPEEEIEGIKLVGTFNNNTGYTLHCYVSDDDLYVADVFYKNTKVVTMTFGPCSTVSDIDDKLAFVMAHGVHEMRTSNGRTWSEYRLPTDNPGIVNIESLWYGVSSSAKGSKWRDSKKGSGSFLARAFSFSGITYFTCVSMNVVYSTIDRNKKLLMAEAVELISTTTGNEYSPISFP